MSNKWGYSTGNLGTRVDLGVQIVRHFERQAYLERQQPQTQRTPDQLLVVYGDGVLGFMTYPEALAEGVRVVRMALNYNHQFPESKLVDVDLVLPPSDLSLNESFYNDISFSYSIRQDPTTGGEE